MSDYRPAIVNMAFARGRALEHVLSTVNSPGKLSTPEKQQHQQVTLCICDRQKQKILCRSCGSVFDGRIRKKCVIHPNEIHLMDILCCPNCKTNYLQEIGGTPATSAREENNNEPATVKKTPTPERVQTGSDHMLLKQITKNMNRSSENWEDDLNLVNNNSYRS